MGGGRGDPRRCTSSGGMAVRLYASKLTGPPHADTRRGSPRPPPAQSKSFKARGTEASKNRETPAALVLSFGTGRESQPDSLGAMGCPSRKGSNASDGAHGARP